MFADATMMSSKHVLPPDDEHILRHRQQHLFATERSLAEPLQARRLAAPAPYPPAEGGIVAPAPAFLRTTAGGMEITYAPSAQGMEGTSLSAVLDVPLLRPDLAPHLHPPAIPARSSLPLSPDSTFDLRNLSLPAQWAQLAGYADVLGASTTASPGFAEVRADYTGGGPVKGKPPPGRKGSKGTHPFDPPERTEPAAAGGKKRMAKAARGDVDLVQMLSHRSHMALDPVGSRYLQQKIDAATEEEKTLALQFLLPKVVTFSMDTFGNHVVQRFLTSLERPEQRRMLGAAFVGQVRLLSFHSYGCRVIQKAFQLLPRPDAIALTRELESHVWECIQDSCANYVLQKVIEEFGSERAGFIIEAIQGRIGVVARHMHGCRVLQWIVERCPPEQIACILDEVVKNAQELATDTFAIFVVQHVLEYSSRPVDRQILMDVVRTHLLAFSCHKCASHLVEKALAVATPVELESIVDVLISPAGVREAPISIMMGDRFGNYIVQRTLALSTGRCREVLVHTLEERLATRLQRPSGRRPPGRWKGLQNVCVALEQAKAEMRRESGLYEA
eukprot:TRINITY_DN11147_c0_g2_i1.p1 TRINITY_DN11147_c0_g2~~TRINITY_DN11147_c0_g2_i1.p1  ORF type:complete len:560 (-),score=92.94 TRINITY_DN11147_c0_g2_i1:138-1817(-)